MCTATKTGWYPIGATDLRRTGQEPGECQRCGKSSLRFLHLVEHSAAVRPQPKIDAPYRSTDDDFATSHREEHHGAFFATARGPSFRSLVWF